MNVFDDNLENLEKASNIVSIENFEEINENFKLKAPKKGKIHRGSNWNAYNRENLGSIPRNTENILIKDQDGNKKIGFTSQSERFSARTQTIKYAFPGPGTYSKDKCWVKNDPSFSSKGFGNGFVSAKDRFDDLKEFKDKYCPGPGNYKTDESSSLTRDISTSISYKSLYNTKSVKSLKIKKEPPGPGFYNPIILARDFDKTQKNFYFKSENERFMMTRLEDFPGPGKYFKKDRNVDKIKEHTISYFFKKPIEKILNPEDKLINKVKEFTLPGPGAYNLRTDLLKKTESKLPFEVEKIKQINATTSLTLKNDKKDLLRTDFYEIPSGFDNIKLGEKTSNFKSNSPQIEKKRKNTPGPAYYRPQILPSKLSYNYNMEKVWI